MYSNVSHPHCTFFIIKHSTHPVKKTLPKQSKYVLYFNLKVAHFKPHVNSSHGSQQGSLFNHSISSVKMKENNTITERLNSPFSG